MGKIVKTVLPVAIGIAAPFVLPAVAPALAASPILSGALTGAIGAAVGGGNILTGALTGGLGGGLSQAFSSFGSGVFNPASPGAASALGGSPSFITGPEFFSTGVGSAGTPFGAVPAASLSGPSFGQTLGTSVDLSGVGSDGFIGGFADDFGGFPGVSTTSSTAGLSVPTSSLDFSGAVTDGAFDSVFTGVPTSDVSASVIPGSGNFAPVTTTAAGATGDGGLLSGNFGKNLGNMGLKLLSSALTEDPDLSAAEDALARQRAFAEAEFGANQEQLDRRNRAANEVMNEFRSIDIRGAQEDAANTARLAMERLIRDRGVDNPNRRDQAITRGLRTRAMASVPQAAAAAGEAARRQQLAGLTGGAGLIPTAFSGGRGFSSVVNSAAELERLRADLEKQRSEGVGSFFSDLFA